MKQIWEILTRWRTWIVNSFGVALLLLPELLNAPEIIAIIPQHYQKYVFAGALVLNILMRPRKALVQSDPAMQVQKAIKNSDEAVHIQVTGVDSDVTKVSTVALPPGLKI